MDACGAPDEHAVKRTMKSCGPDAAMLASTRDNALHCVGTVANKPFAGESTKETVKTNRAGNAGMFRRTCGD
jgi:hypothetical protein